MPDDRVVHRLKLRELRVLLAVTHAGSMAKAAAQLAISQPAVSRAIADMESTLGVSLLNRTSQGVEPTPYGRALIKRGVAVFDELRQGVKEIEFIADPTAGEVRIGGTSATVVGIVAAEHQVKPMRAAASGSACTVGTRRGTCTPAVHRPASLRHRRMLDRPPRPGKVESPWR